MFNMFNKLGFVLLLFSDRKAFFYKLIDIDGQMGCVHAFTTQAIASKFGGSKGTCDEVDCLVPSGIKNILLVGKVYGFYC